MISRMHTRYAIHELQGGVLKLWVRSWKMLIMKYDENIDNIYYVFDYAYDCACEPNPLAAMRPGTACRP